jgi:hypothetical protein
MRKLPFLFFSVFSHLFFVRPCSALENTQLVRFFSQNIQAAQDVMASQTPTPGSAPYLAFQDYNVDITPTISIGVSDVLNVSVMPEIDFVFAPPQTRLGQ